VYSEQIAHCHSSVVSIIRSLKALVASRMSSEERNTWYDEKESFEHTVQYRVVSGHVGDIVGGGSLLQPACERPLVTSSSTSSNFGEV